MSTMDDTEAQEFLSDLLTNQPVMYGPDFDITAEYRLRSALRGRTRPSGRSPTPPTSPSG